MDSEKKNHRVGLILIMTGLAFAFLVGVIAGAVIMKDETVRCVKECDTKHQELYWVDATHCACK